MNLPEHSCEQAFMLSQDDFDRFARLSGDHNPIHVDPAFAARTRFGRTVSHGMLLFTALRGLLAQCYPGATLLRQSLVFPAPAFADEALELTLVPSGSGGDDIELDARIVRPDGECCLQGLCVIRLPGETAT